LSTFGLPERDIVGSDQEISGFCSGKSRLVKANRLIGHGVGFSALESAFGPASGQVRNIRLSIRELHELLNFKTAILSKF